MLERFFERIRDKETNSSSPSVLLCALGDSVTQGCMRIDTFDFRHVYHSVLKAMIEARFPKTTFSVLNAGAGGECAGDGLKRLERDVVRHGPDLTLVAFGLNDAVRGLRGLPLYRSNIRKIFEGVRSGCQSDIIAMTPGFMASRETRRIAKKHLQFAPAIIQVQNNGVLSAYVEALKKVASAACVPVADIHACWERMAMEGRDTTEMLVNGLNHPDRAGHKLAAETILQTILECQPSKGISLHS